VAYQRFVYRLSNRIILCIRCVQRMQVGVRSEVGPIGSDQLRHHRQRPLVRLQGRRVLWRRCGESTVRQRGRATGHQAAEGWCSFGMARGRVTEELTIEVSRMSGVYSFRRRDGQHFFMIQQDGRGNAALFAGSSPDRPPQKGIVEFDASISDKIAAPNVGCSPIRPPLMATAGGPVRSGSATNADQENFCLNRGTDHGGRADFDGRRTLPSNPPKTLTGLD
jgi:hypothetical protein